MGPVDLFLPGEEERGEGRGGALTGGGGWRVPTTREPSVSDFQERYCTRVQTRGVCHIFKELYVLFVIEGGS